MIGAGGGGLVGDGGSVQNTSPESSVTPSQEETSRQTKVGVG